MSATQKSLQGQVVLVTGAASGIGAATALELLQRGALPVLVDCDAEPLAHMAERCGPGTMHLVADVTDLAAMEQVVRAALPAVMQTRGYVLINASVSSFAHPPVMSAYAASKSAVEAMGNSWRIELAAHGVDVGVVHAGWVRTPLVTEGALHPGFVRLRATMPGPMNSETTPEDAARAIVTGMANRKSRIFIPGWLRLLYALRALLHLPFAERELRRAAPEIEAIYIEGLQAEGALASSFGPRERERTLERARREG